MQFKIFKNHNLIQGISEVKFGSFNHHWVDRKKINDNAIRFLRNIGFSDFNHQNLVYAEQIFSSAVHICSKKDWGKVIKKVDGLISNIPDQILIIKSADCVPILLFDPKAKVVATLHGARTSLVKGIIPETISKMINIFGSSAKDILVGLGPHIRVCHYWLKKKTEENLKRTYFKKYFHFNDGIVQKKDSKIFFDLTKLVKDQFRKLGINEKNIEDCKICTFCHFKKYFSARKNEESPGIYLEKEPRFASFIGIKSPATKNLPN